MKNFNKIIMKKIFLSLAIILFTLIAKSQSLVDTNFVWSEINETYNYLDTIRQTKYIKFSGDTIIGTRHYKKVMRSDDEFMTTWYHYNDYYIREDTSKKVYLYTNDKDKLIYDFGINIGDTINLEYGDSFTAYVDTIYTENVLGINRRKIILIDNQGNQGIWYENIGNIAEPNVLLPVYGSCFCGITGPALEILCVKENGNLIYQNTNYSECFYLTDINTGQLNNTTKNIYPNPAKNILHISINNNNLNINVKLYNSLGKVVYNEDFTNQSTINTSKFSSGIYFLKLTNAKKSIVEKIIIQ